MVINIFAGHADRSLSQTQLAELLDKLLARHPGSAVILLDHRREIRIPLPPEVVINPFNTLHHAMALIAQAELIISPDTSVVHMAAAWNKPLIAVYKDVLLNNRLWAPGYDNARQIIVKCGKVHQHRGLVDRIIAVQRLFGKLEGYGGREFVGVEPDVAFAAQPASGLIRGQRADVGAG